MYKQLLFAMAFLFQLLPSKAQDYSRLQQIKGHPFPVYHSNGQTNRAVNISGRCADAMAYISRSLKTKPRFTLLVLTQEDWPHFTKFPVYGMPHYNDDSTLVVAAEDNAFWKSFIPKMDQLPETMRQKIRQAYSSAGGEISMAPFFDLLVLHELGHAFHFQGGLNMPRKWMGELFCNVLLHTYIAEKDPAYLPALTVFPEMVIGGGTDGYRYTSLLDLEAYYDEIGMNHPNNYGWYQSRLHAGAKTIYDAAGAGVLDKLWKSLLVKSGFPDDKSLAAYLGKNVHPKMAELILNW
ncbi:hypothetical protein ACFSQD_00620 [Flavihumibacter stibioxidans]|nr:hypothetical protein [Flavihumibacter stibioxidans]